MSYIVVYQSTDGSSGVEECADLDLAIVTAERLRNVDSVERPRIFKTEEIRYDFRPYYRVEVEGKAASLDSAASATATAPVDFTESASISEAVESEPATSSLGEHVSSPFDEHVSSPLDDVSSPLDEHISSPLDDVSSPLDDITPPPPLPAEELVPPAVPHSPAGLFGKTTESETADLSDVVEEAASEPESEAPRRGLFGR